MSRVHLALNTDRLEESIDFYRALFDTEPARVKPDWAKFDLQEPALNLTLNRVSEAPAGGDISHLGVEVPDSAAVASADRRLREKGLETLVEDDVTCCYAVQDKTWVRDPNGHSWEFFFVKD
jgi:catechol 2,3-dioxygenase-like lactoylglutathione lyase family enzyme